MCCSWRTARICDASDGGETTNADRVVEVCTKTKKIKKSEVRQTSAGILGGTIDEKIAFFCESEDWIIDRKDPIAQEIIRLVQKAKLKTKVHEHKGTYRMRAWLMFESASPAPFGRQEA